MIEITWDRAFLLYLTFALIFLFGFWLTSHFNRKKRKILLNCQNITVCEYCHNTYATVRGEAFSRCPSCLILNKSGEL